MKIAVTYQNGEVFQHFGHCETFKVYTVEGLAVTSTEVVSAVGSGHGALAGFLKSLGANALICGGIGGGAKNALLALGIPFYCGVSGDADASVAAFVKGDLKYNLDITCNHHAEGHDCAHDCGSEAHQCGEDKHGCAGN